MNTQTQVSPESRASGVAEKLRAIDWERVGVFYARLALGSAFLSAVASRFGLWDGTLDLKHFARFLEYAGEVNSFMPRAAIPFIAWAATAAETSFGILLILGLWPRWVSLGAAILLAMFATAMAVSFGLKSPLDYSVYSASGAALLLALRAFGRSGK
ncbi:MAG: DoxX family protein [Candidatus Acidiferrales bacterium]